MLRIALLSPLLFSFALPAIAQSAAPPPTALYVAGTVVEEPGSHPLKKVLVQIVSETQAQTASYAATTDSDGHFRVDNIAPGRYRVFFEKSGFAGVNSRSQRSEVNVITVQAGKPGDDFVFQMLPTAAITGRVTDEDGDPMSNVRVIIQKKIPGKSRRATVTAVGTNDLGEYRAAGLFPGQYWVAAVPPPDPRDYERPAKNPPPAQQAEDQPEIRYVTEYYPGTTDISQATPIALKAGDETPVNMALVPSRTYRIRGVVASLLPGQRPSVELASKNGDAAAGTEVASDGSFELHGVAPGSYVLKSFSTAESSVLTARQDVTVTASDVDGEKLIPMPDFTISGHLRADARSTLDLSQFSVNLRAADVGDDTGFFKTEDSFGENAQVDRQGNFSWKHVNPGNYIVRLYGGSGQDSFFLKSAHVGANNIDAAFSLNGPVVLDLVISDKGGIVEGIVTYRNRQGEDQQGTDAPVPNAEVVAVPEAKYRNIPERFGEGATDQFGRFTIRGLAPGSYTLFAWQDVGDDLYRDPDFLKSQEADGATAKIEEGSHQTLVLRLSPVGDNWE
ncbi:MAG: carboxypeptidase regulatory-like domain-containing protein [Terriglobales bacterium]